VKWLVIIIVILIVIAVAMLWLRTARQGPSTVDSRQPHRLDDSVMPPASPGLRVDTPTTTAAAAEAGADEGVSKGPQVPGPQEPADPDDLPPSETRPDA
jgi:predicted lipid-binding transport protein (Tim44 family)